MTKYQCVYIAVKLFELEFIGWMRHPSPQAAAARDAARKDMIDLAMAESDEAAVKMAIAQAEWRKERA